MKIYRFNIVTEKGVKIQYPIKEEVTIDEWERMTEHINKILIGLKE